MRKCLSGLLFSARHRLGTLGASRNWTAVVPFLAFPIGGHKEPSIWQISHGKYRLLTSGPQRPGRFAPLPWRSSSGPSANGPTRTPARWTPGPRRRATGSRLDPYRAVVDLLVADGVWNAVGIWRELQAKGMQEGSPSCATTSIPSVDCGPASRQSGLRRIPGGSSRAIGRPQRTVVAGEATTVHVVVNTLSYSRRFHFWCAETEDAEHTYEGLVRAFEWFGGAPGDANRLGPGWKRRVA
jgi:hypothetical protein